MNLISSEYSTNTCLHGGGSPIAYLKNRFSNFFSSPESLTSTSAASEQICYPKKKLIIIILVLLFLLSCLSVVAYFIKTRYYDNYENYEESYRNRQRYID
ncbi:hypothetical protein Hokovirus_4_75 [Hokovirus HKV1]|uniref:Uncharacterized protein n=1 Tax=Hokovirus HKV1 TaxID=1977638 RepID=A0A1V0SHF8_9VIRU|nr:hypothetical protein Hokovirus_4_75 [Hokovirus HKV1]